MKPYFPDPTPHLGNLSRILPYQTRSITAENPTGEKGKGAMAHPEGENHPARELGHGWKCRPSIMIAPGETSEVATIEGPGAIQHIWMAVDAVWRHVILRVYWDGQEQPSIECPLGDFFACGWGNRKEFAQVNSLPVCVNPGGAFNSFWEMPFRKKCRVTMENLGVRDAQVYYQFDYTLGEVPENCGYFHAHFRRVNPLPKLETCKILDGVTGSGHYVGTYLAWGANNAGWWGEGEIKFYLDGDDKYPTICGTGTEDYFCGSFNFENRKTGQYQEFSTPYAGMPHIIRPDGVYNSQQRFSLYRWHIADPIRFEEDIRVDIQALGLRSEVRLMPLQDDISSVAYWYQELPTAPFQSLPSVNDLEIV